MTDAANKWIEAGYELFAYEGPDGVQIEKLARKVGLNKSGFYHHFGDREIYFCEIIKHHYLVTEKFREELKKAEKFDPDALNLLIKYRISSLVQAQLRRQHYDKSMYNAFLQVKTKNSKLFGPLWAEYLQIPNNPTLADELWDIMRDVYFAHIANPDITYKTLSPIVHKFFRVVQELKRYKGKQD